MGKKKEVSGQDWSGSTDEGSPKNLSPDELAEASHSTRRLLRTRPKSVITLAVIFGILLAGFWGPQIGREIGIPIDPATYEAVFFQNPEIVGTGLVAGDLVVFGITNGSRAAQTITWTMASGTTVIHQGVVNLAPNSQQLVAQTSDGAVAGDRLSIGISGLANPITVEVVGE